MTAVIPGTTTPAAEQAGSDLPALVALSLAALAAGRAARGGPVPAGEPAQVAADVDAALGEGVLPEVGSGERAALAGLVAAVAAGAADPADPMCAAHLHCPPLPVAVAADLAASALNQSLDSWDQAPAATVLEERVVAALAGLAGLRGGSGVLTTGGTGSTYTALLLARDAAAGPVRLYASAAAHFSVERAAHLLGLPRVVAVPLGEDQAMDAAALAALLRAAPATERPVVVATAGTTDLGSIDPLPAIGQLVSAAGGWLHVDAAYGGGVLFSDRRRSLLAGIERADSVSLDLHKFGWQPAAAGVLLTRDAAAFAPLARRAAYLNPADDEAADYPSLLGRSLRTTRRADVLKVAVTLRALGRSGLGALVDTCCDLAGYAAARVCSEPLLELAADPVLSSVVFRHRGGDAVNAGLRRRLLREGRAVVGRTELAGQVFLKLTLLNPAATPADVDALLDLVLAAARAEEGAS
ncbi:pyridoxal phosphate-dependent decarboxylase family protein [Blastococcus saxobsidens]|uniref:L-2,4-diaminobutyrate decarboxylase n=1 Tax=Blastococcus saxobsidens TaxID=138336 RepID=A0A4Q7Y3Q9_9ACTN|nr:aminotransferase class I/II-fold pyridoxal phosphate-dependent enzyme [Blastococcus saxobsidens]RZU30721.1 L-2,4-diaminobutyrate decarboxylase [Blastococcus saxobsidens]